MTLIGLCAIATATPYTVRVVPGVTLAPGDTLGVGEARVVRRSRVARWYVVSSPEPALEQLRGLPFVEIAEEDTPLSLWDADPDRPYQWALENEPTWNGSFDADIDVEAAWDAGTRGEGVVVAVLDTGVDLDHPDLTASLWTNPGEIPDNGEDDDGNGFADDVHGVDVVDGGIPEDPLGHGTGVAGIVAMEVNSIGGCGIAPDARIMAVRIFGKGGFGSNAADGIVYAAEMGADVMVASWSHGREPKTIVSDALEQASAALFVTAAGNLPLDTDENGLYPARYPHPNVVAVAACDRHDRLVDQPGLWASAYGVQTVELCAPGDALWTTYAGGGHGPFSGSSASAPVVAAVAALVLSSFPGRTPTQMVDDLVASVDPNGTPTFSAGRVNAANALQAAGGVLPVSIEASGTPSPRPGDVATFTALGPDAGEYTWYFPDSDEFVEGTTVQHVFESPGPWEIAVEGVMPDGWRSRASVTADLPITWADAAWDLVETPHDEDPMEGIVEHDAGGWFRLHFSRVSFEQSSPSASDAYVAVLDEVGQVLWSFEGEASDLWTPALHADDLILLWYAANDGPKRSWGFAADRMQRPADPEVDPGEPDPIARPDPEALRGGGWSCSATPVPPGAPTPPVPFSVFLAAATSLLSRGWRRAGTSPTWRTPLAAPPSRAAAPRPVSPAP